MNYKVYVRLVSVANGKEFLYFGGSEKAVRTVMKSLDDNCVNAWMIHPDGTKEWPDGKKEPVTVLLVDDETKLEDLAAQANEVMKEQLAKAIDNEQNSRAINNKLIQENKELKKELNSKKCYCDMCERTEFFKKISNQLNAEDGARLIEIWDSIRDEQSEDECKMFFLEKQLIERLTPEQKEEDNFYNLHERINRVINDRVFEAALKRFRIDFIDFQLTWDKAGTFAGMPLEYQLAVLIAENYESKK